MEIYGICNHNVEKSMNGAIALLPTISMNGIFTMLPTKCFCNYCAAKKSNLQLINLKLAEVH